MSEAHNLPEPDASEQMAVILLRALLSGKTDAKLLKAARRILSVANALERAGQSSANVYPARTPEGLAIKAGMAIYVMGDEPDGTREDSAARAVLADLLAERHGRMRT